MLSSPNLILIATWALCLPTIIQSANILFFAPASSLSMKLSQYPLAESLADKGHNVTFLSPYGDEDPTTKSKVYSYVPKKIERIWEGVLSEKMDVYGNRKRKSSALKLWTEFFGLSEMICEFLYSDPQFVEWVKTHKFDFVVLDTVVNECGYGLIWLWKAKYATYVTSGSLPFSSDGFGIPDESSSVPIQILGIADGTKMPFSERVYNAVMPVLLKLYRDYKTFPGLEAITRNGLGEELTKSLPSFGEMEKQTNLVLATTHFSFDQAASYPPNVIPVGGVVVTKKQKPLPKEMKDFMDCSDGFVYISFGTIAEFTEFDEEVQIEFINALRHFPDIKFLWKSKPINATTLPDNVLSVRWVPQQTVLAHPKIRLFVTHSGMGSTLEAIHYSVPQICIPVLADQDLLAAMTQQRQAGIRLEIVGLKEAQLVNALHEILHNKKYREGMTRLTAIFKDRPSPPLETAVWWVEYILRHDNTNEFLLSPSALQPWWKRRQIDVWAVVIMAAFLVVSIPLSFIFCILKKMFGRKTTTNKKLKVN